MNKEQVLSICDNLIDQLTVLKGFIQLDKMNNKLDHSLILLKEMERMERIVYELINQLMTMD